MLGYIACHISNHITSLPHLRVSTFPRSKSSPPYRPSPPPDPLLTKPHSAHLKHTPIPLAPLPLLPPLLQQDHHLRSRILHNPIHLDVIPIIPKRILQLNANPFNPIQRERYNRHHGNTVPAVGIHHGEGQDRNIQEEHLRGVDQVSDR